jgi:hypothetical protein
MKKPFYFSFFKEFRGFFAENVSPALSASVLHRKCAVRGLLPAEKACKPASSLRRPVVVSPEEGYL